MLQDLVLKQGVLERLKKFHDWTRPLVQSVCTYSICLLHYIMMCVPFCVVMVFVAVLKPSTFIILSGNFIPNSRNCHTMKTSLQKCNIVVSVASKYGY